MKRCEASEINGIRIDTTFDQDLNNIKEPKTSGNMKGSRIVFAVLIDVCTGGKKEITDGGISRGNGEDKRSVSVLISEMNGGSAFDELLNDLFVLIDDGSSERSLEIEVELIDCCTFDDEQKADLC